MESEKTVEDLLKLCNAIWIYQGKEGEPHAFLTSGKHSDGYINLNAVLKFPNLCEILAGELIKKLEKEVPGFKKRVKVVVSSSMAAITLGYEVARQLRKMFVFTEKKEGTQKWTGRFEIPPEGAILQVEELITTLKTTRQVKEAILTANPRVEFLKNREGKIVVATVVHRPQDLSQKDPEYEVIALLSKEIHSWEPEKCPLCKKGSIALKPKANWKRFLEHR